MGVKVLPGGCLIGTAIFQIYYKVPELNIRLPSINGPVDLVVFSGISHIDNATLGETIYVFLTPNIKISD